MFCQFLLYRRVTELYIYIHSFSHILSQVIGCSLSFQISVPSHLVKWLLMQSYRLPLAGGASGALNASSSELFILSLAACPHLWSESLQISPSGLCHHSLPMYPLVLLCH